ncbi:MAG: PPC domain-containing DNA-binding protein [Syntrophobacteraceae bacterium]|nr:DNA-binding protein [Desulfobacteraceae bacterium]
MQYSEGSLGRVFTLRLETGDRLPDTIEAFARDHDVKRAMVVYIGGAGEGSRVVAGPEEGRGDAIIPIVHALKGRQEVVGVGTLFPKESGEPTLHMHAATGREGYATVGCVRAGVNAWLVGEVIILEILGTDGLRVMEPSGMELLQFKKRGS